MRRIERWPFVWAAIVTVLLITLAGMTIAYLNGSAAKDCTNRVLGARAAVTQADQEAHIAFADVVLAAVTRQPLSASDARAIARALGVRTQAGKAISQRDTLAAIRSYRDSLINDQTYRDAHPLGRC